MLHELAVTDLGVIERLSLVLGPGMTALTGETGAGKTLLVTAIDLLVGGRADPVLVRPGAEEARVEGRFVHGGEEVVLCRVVPRTGRSRAYVDGRLATVAQLAEAGTALVDLHGQHAHQSLLAPATQRAALDRFAGSDLGPLAEARAEVAGIDRALAALGGDSRARARELDLLRFQVGELDAAELDDPDEEAALERLQDVLDDAQAHRGAAAGAVEALHGDGGVEELLGVAAHALSERAPFADHHDRLRGLAAEVAELATDLRAAGEAIPDDPERLEEIRRRRALLRDLRRKYGESLADVLAFAAEARARLAELEGHDERAAALERRRGGAIAARDAAAAELARVRRAGAPALAAAVEAHLRELALPKARLVVEVGEDDPGDDVRFLLAANPGEPPLPLSKVASGGELARTMLALRLVLTLAPPTLVFDEVDAGIGGEAALAVGRSLGALARDAAADGDRQVLVVTHLAQVAAHADAHVVVAKGEEGGRTVARATPVEGAARVAELSRMLSGLPDSGSGREHAAELLAEAARRGDGSEEGAPGGAPPRRRGRAGAGRGALRGAPQGAR
jgi:DNA repair protein RecN (Recombination protein N)